MTNMTSTANRPVVSTASGRRRNKSGNPLVDAYLAHCNTRNAAPSSVVLAALSNATTTAPSNASTLASASASASASGSAPAKAPVSAHHKTDGNIFGGATIQLNADLVPREEEWERLFQALRGGTGIDGIHIWSNHIDERRKAEQLAKQKVTAAASTAANRRSGAAAMTKGKTWEPKIPAQQLLPVILRSASLALPDLLKTMRDALLNSRTLTIVELSGLKLTPAMLKNLGTGIEQSTSLQTLLLRRTSIGDAGLSQLAGSLRLSKSLNHVSLGGCELTRHCASIVTDIIKFQFVIRSSARWTASLRDDLVEEQERARDPAQRQRAPRAMKRLDLCNNRLGDLGAIVLSEALRDPVGFQALDLQYNLIGDEGAQSLFQMAVENRDVVLIDLRNNPIKPALIAKIEVQLIKNAQQLYRKLHKAPVDIPELAHVTYALNDEDLVMLDGESPLRASYHHPIQNNLRPPTFPRDNKSWSSSTGSLKPEIKRNLSKTSVSMGSSNAVNAHKTKPLFGRQPSTASMQRLAAKQTQHQPRGHHHVQPPSSVRVTSRQAHDPNSKNPLGCNCHECETTLRLWQMEREARAQSEHRLMDLEKIIGSLTSLFRRGAASVDSDGTTRADEFDSPVNPSSRASPIGLQYRQATGSVPPARSRPVSVARTHGHPIVLARTSSVSQSPPLDVDVFSSVTSPLPAPISMESTRADPQETNVDGSNVQAEFIAHTASSNSHSDGMSLYRLSRDNLLQSVESDALPVTVRLEPAAHFDAENLRPPSTNSAGLPSDRSHSAMSLGAVSKYGGSVASGAAINPENVERFEQLLTVLESSMTGFNHLLDRLEKNRD